MDESGQPTPPPAPPPMAPPVPPRVGDWNPRWIDAEAEMCRLIYYSSVTGRVTKADLKAILTSSRHNNALLGVTGALGFNNSFFLQILEGKRISVNKLYSRILADPRHRDVNIILFTPIEARLFPHWSMLFIGDDRLTQETCRRFCGVTSFRPERLTAEMAVALVAHLAAETTAPPEAAAHSPV